MEYNNEEVTVKEWIMSILLMCIPIVNIVLMFVWAFSNSEKRSKSNFFKASLIVSAIILVLQIIAVIMFGGAIFSLLLRL